MKDFYLDKTKQSAHFGKYAYNKATHGATLNYTTGKKRCTSLNLSQCRLVAFSKAIIIVPKCAHCFVLSK